MADSVTKKIASASTWNVAFAGLQIFVQIGIFAALARILSPQDYGVFAFANAILVYIVHVSQRGLTAGLLRRTTMTPEEVAGAYHMCIIVSLGTLAAMGAAYAGMIAWLGPDMRMQADILLFMGLPLTLQILASPATAKLQRELRYVSINLIQIGSIALGNGLVTILCALAGLGPWSLAYGAAATAGLNAVLVLWRGWEPMRLVWRGRDIWALLKEAVGFNILRVLDVSWVQSPIVIYGATSSAAAVGIYQRVQYLADLALQMTVWRVNAVVYSALGARSDGATINLGQYRLVLTVLAALTLPIAAFLIAAAPEIVAVMLGPNWLEGAPVLRVIAIGFAIYTINHAASMALEHAGRFTQRAIQAGLALAVMIPLLLLTPANDLNRFAYPAVVSMIVGSAAMHYFVGERWRTIPGFLAALAPGFLLAAGSAGGAIGGRAACAALGLEGAGLVLLGQLIGGGLGCLAVLPLIARLPALKPFIEIARNKAPRLVRLTRPLHWLSL